MSIASRIASIENHIEEAYTEISRLGVDLTNVDKNIDNIADKLQDVYADLPKVTGEGSSLSLTPTREGGLSIIPKGACEQDSYSGKNKVDYDGTQVTLVEDTARTINIIPDNFPITLQAGTYVVSFPDLVCTNSSYTNTLGCQLIKQGGGNISLFVVNETKQVSFTLNEELTFVRFYLYIRETDNTNATATFSKIQLESGSTATDYEQYVGGIPSPNPDYPQDIRVVTGDNDVVVNGKNLFNKQIAQIGKNWNGSNMAYSIASDYIEVTSNETYSITVTNMSNYVSATLVQFNENEEFVTSASDFTTLTLQSNTKKIKVSLRSNSSYTWTQTDLDNAKIQIEKGNATTYEPYYTPQTYALHLGTEYLAGIGDYRDEIVGKTDEWKIRRYVGKKILNGSESWSLGSSGTNVNTQRFFGFNNIGVNSTKVYCNNFTDFNYTWNQIQANDVQLVAYSNNYLQIKIDKTKASTTTEFKNWLSSNNTIVYYRLATEIEETITDTTLITDLNNMYQAMGYDGTTNITITSTSGNAQMTASVSALKGE